MHREVRLEHAWTAQNSVQMDSNSLGVALLGNSWLFASRSNVGTCHAAYAARHGSCRMPWIVRPGSRFLGVSSTISGEGRACHGDTKFGRRPAASQA